MATKTESVTGFSRPKRFDFLCEGLDVNCPIDHPKAPHKFPYMLNVDSDVDGSISPRAGATVGAGGGVPIAAKTPLHTIRRINNPNTSAWCRVFGTGDSLAAELSSAPGTYNNIDSGYSGNPLTSCPWRPTEATEPSLYIGDSLRNRKVSVSGVDKQIGLPPPQRPPTVAVGRRLYKEIGVTNSTVDWLTIAQTGVCGAPTTAARLTTAAATLIYDTGTSGWVSILVASLTDIGPGTLLAGSVSGQEIMVSEVHRGSTATTIKQIIYDSGTTGICTIYPEQPVKEIRQNAIVKLGAGGGAENVRVLSISTGPDDNFSFRCSTVSTRAATDALQVIGSIRGYDVGGLIAGENLSKAYIQTVTTGTGTGTITYNPPLSDIDLSVLGGYTGFGGAFGDEDYFHLGLFASDLSLISSIRIMWDVDDDSFTRNFFYHTVEQSVLVAAAKGTQSITDVNLRDHRNTIASSGSRPFASQFDQPILRGPDDSSFGARLDRQLLDEPFVDSTTPDTEVGAPSAAAPRSETGTGDNQWSEITFKRGQCLRSGSQLGLGWNAVKSVRLEINCTAAVTVRVNSIVAYGSFAPDVGQAGLPYKYRYRGRDSSTGTVSDYSQPCYEDVLLYRDHASVNLVLHPSPECDKLDVERFGGLQDGWLLVGSISNSGTPVFDDKISENAARANVERSDYRIIQPWCRFGAPLTGTASVVAGDAVQDNGANPLPANLLPGTPIIINSILTVFLGYISATAPFTKFRISDAIGAYTNVTWEIPRPVTYGNPLRSIFGGMFNGDGVLFACDGSFLRWSVGNNFDATREEYFVEAADPSDPLIGGVLFNSRVWVFTSRRLLAATGDPVNGFTVDEIPSGHGLVAPWALAYDGSSALAWIAWDGIYASTGEIPLNVTADDLKPLFPYGSRPGADTNGISAPVLTAAETPNLRLSWREDRSLDFFYRDGSGNRRNLRYIPGRGWRYNIFAKPFCMSYAEEGEGVRNLLYGGADAPSGKVYVSGGAAATDDGTGFDWAASSYFDDLGDWRPRKRISEIVSDVDPNNTTVNVALLTDNSSTPIAISPATVTGAVRAPRTIHDAGSGAGIRCRNFSVLLSGTTSANTHPRIYGYEPSVAYQPEPIKLRTFEPSDCGYFGDKFMQAAKIDCDTYGQDKVISITHDGGTLGATITVNHNGRRRETYAFPTPFVGRIISVSTADTDDWEPYDWEWIFNRESPAAKTWRTQPTSLGIDNYKHIFYVQLPVASTDVITLKLYADGSAAAFATLTLASTAGLWALSVPIIIPAKKFKLVEFELTSPADFRCHLKDLVVKVKGFDSDGDYEVVRPFGEEHFDSGARA